jgi:uncharacterized protein Yka (UPF0111/DUF47 family)
LDGKSPSEGTGQAVKEMSHKEKKMRLLEDIQRRIVLKTQAMELLKGEYTDRIKSLQNEINRLQKDAECITRSYRTSE